MTKYKSDSSNQGKFESPENTFSHNDSCKGTLAVYRGKSDSDSLETLVIPECPDLCQELNYVGPVRRFFLTIGDYLGFVDALKAKKKYLAKRFEIRLRQYERKYDSAVQQLKQQDAASQRWVDYVHEKENHLSDLLTQKRELHSQISELSDSILNTRTFLELMTMETTSKSELNEGVPPEVIQKGLTYRLGQDEKSLRKALVDVALLKDQIIFYGVTLRKDNEIIAHMAPLLEEARSHFFHAKMWLEEAKKGGLAKARLLQLMGNMEELRSDGEKLVGDMEQLDDVILNAMIALQSKKSTLPKNLEQLEAEEEVEYICADSSPLPTDYSSLDLDVTAEEIEEAEEVTKRK